MGILRTFLLEFLSELSKPKRHDPFHGEGEPYFRNGLMSDEEYSNYIESTYANNYGAGNYNHRTGMYDNGCDLFGYYDDND